MTVAMILANKEQPAKCFENMTYSQIDETKIVNSKILYQSCPPKKEENVLLILKDDRSG